MNFYKIKKLIDLSLMSDGFRFEVLREKNNRYVTKLYIKTEKNKNYICISDDGICIESISDFLKKID